MCRRAITILIITILAFPVFASPILKNGAPCPSFTLPDLSGEKVSLESRIGTRPALLHFFASWSKPCREEVAFLNGLQEKYAGKGLEIIGVSYDRNPGELKNFIDENKIKFTVLNDKKLKTLKTFGILIIPTLFVISPDGTIDNIYVDFDKNVEKAVLKDLARLLTP